MKVNSNPLINIIIPTYNSGNTIERALKSVLKQTYQDYEILVCDDASNDNTCDIVDTYTCYNPNIRLLKQSINSGAGAARNLGMRNAAGKYIAFLDSDDEWLPEKLEYQVKALEHTNRGKVCICGANVFSTDFKFLKKYIPNPNWEQSSFKKFITGSIPVLTPTIVFETSLLKAAGFMVQQMRRGQDMEFLLRLLAISDLVVVKKDLANIYLELRTSHKQVYEKQFEAYPFRKNQVALIRDKLGGYYAHYYEARLQTSLLLSAIREKKWSRVLFHFKLRLITLPFLTPEDFVKILKAFFSLTLRG